MWPFDSNDEGSKNGREKLFKIAEHFNIPYADVVVLYKEAFETIRKYNTDKNEMWIGVHAINSTNGELAKPRELDDYFEKGEVKVCVDVGDKLFEQLTFVSKFKGVEIEDLVLRCIVFYMRSFEWEV